MDTINEENPAGSNLPEGGHALQNAKGWLQSILEMVEELKQAEADEHPMGNSEEAIRAHIEESVFSIEVRTGWFMPGSLESANIDEYRILLTWGGPALQLVGSIGDHGQPDDWPRLEYQDWSTPWTEYLPAREHREALQKFASVFWYGDN